MKRITERNLSCFREKLIREEKSRLTVEKYLRDVRAFAAFAGEAAVTKELAVAYKQKLLEEGFATRSINSMVASLNSYFVFCGWEECRLRSVQIQQTVFCPEEKELTKKEYERLCNTAMRQRDERLCLIMQTLCGTGIRVSELSFITVETVRAGVAKVFCKRKVREVFLVQELRRKLLSFAERHGIRDGYIFRSRDGSPLCRTTVWRQMKGLCAAAGVSFTKVFPHNLRHLFARVFYDMEKDIVKLADLLGHSNVNTTRIYIVTTGIEHRRKMERMRLIL